MNFKWLLIKPLLLLTFFMRHITVLQAILISVILIISDLFIPTLILPLPILRSLNIFDKAQIFHMLFGIVFCLFLSKWSKVPFLKELNPAHIKNHGTLILLGFLLCYLLIPFNHLLIFAEYIFKKGSAVPLFTGKFHLSYYLKYFFFICCIVPIIEEYVFRGVLLNRLRIHKKQWFSILLSASLFALAHIDPLKVFPTLLLGVVASIIYLKSNKLIAAIVFHGAYNLFGIILALLSTARPTYFFSELYLISYLPCLLITIFLLRRIRFN